MADITLTLSKDDYARAVAALASATGGLGIEDALYAYIAATVDNIERGAAVQAAVEAVAVEPLAVAATVEQAKDALRVAPVEAVGESRDRA